MSSSSDTKTIEIIIKGQAANATMREIQSSARILAAEMKKLPVNSKEFADKSSELRKVNQRLNEIKKDAGQVKESFGSMAKEFIMANVIERAGEAIMDFGKESVKAFIDAEKNAHDLKFALENISGEGNGALTKLLEQSEELQKKGIFSDDDIQKAQTAQVQFGLTSDQVEKLTPQILDLAAAQGIDLASATDKVLSAVNGQTKGLKLAGIAFDDTGDKTKNLAILTEKLSKFQGANADALETTAGKMKRLENVFDDFKEKVGEYLVNEGAKILDNFQTVFGGKGQEIATRNTIAKYIAFLDEGNQKASEKIASGEKTKAQVIADNNKYIAQLFVLRGKQENFEQQKAIDAQIANQQKFNAELRKNQDEVSDNLTQKGVANQEAYNKQILAAREKLLKELEALEYEYSLKGLTEEDKKIFAIHKKYATLKEEANGNSEDLLRIQKDYSKELNAATGEMDSKQLEQHQQYADQMVAVDVKQLDSSEKAYALDFQDKLTMAYEFFKKYAGLYDEFASRANKIMDIWQKKQILRDNAVLKNNDQNLTSEQQQNDEHLRAKLITQKEHDQKAVALQKAHDKRKADIEHKAAERAKKIAIAKAVIDGISAVIKDLASYAYPYNLVVAALDAAIVGAEVAVMKSTPAYAKGGFNTSNNPQGFTNGATLYNNSASGQPFIAGEKGREWIAPNWMLQTPATANVIGQLENIRQTKQFGQGGSTGAVNNVGASQMSNGELISALNTLNGILASGIEAHLYYDNYKRTLDKIDNAKAAGRVG